MIKKEIDIEVKEETLSLVTNITYASVPAWYDATYRDLKMDLVIPKFREGIEARPLVVWICGGAFMRMDRSVWMPELIRLSRAGFSVAAVDYRTNNETAFPGPLCDIKAAIRFLKAHSERFAINPEQIFVMGESAGGTLAGLAGVCVKNDEYEVGDYLEEDSSVAGVIDFYSPIDFSKVDFTIESDVVPSWAIPAFIGTTTNAELIERASVINYVNENTVPFLIFHGTKDVVVPQQQSDMLYEKLVKNQVYTEYYILHGAEHGDPMFYQDQVFEYIIHFMQHVISV